MLSRDQILDYVVDPISDVYAHPFMYAETATAIEAILNLYHDLWAVILERQKDFLIARSAVHSEEVANADLFSNNYARSHPQSTEADRAEYAISRWQKIDKLLNFGSD